MEMKIALIGNPNCGKTTLFNELTGSKQYVGNWPGVTVEKKEGQLKGHKGVTIVDLPGIYSLSPYTMEEVVSREFLVNERPDAIINLVDSTNIERNLYLTDQLAELEIPMVVALNMYDVLEKNGDSINKEIIEKEFGCRVVEMSALKNRGIMESAELAIALGIEDLHIHEDEEEQMHRHPSRPFEKDIEKAVLEIQKIVEERNQELVNPRWYSIKLFERDRKVAKEVNVTIEKIEEIIKAVELKYDDDAEAVITNGRYERVTAMARKAVKKGSEGMSFTEKLDRILTHRILALPIFAVIMTGVYFIAVTTLGSFLTDWVNDVFFGEWIQPAVTGFMESAGTAAWMQSLVVDGIIGGVGAVLGFVPQMALLFLMLSFLEDCGYMSRVAFMMDRVFRKFGLSGKSFIPLLVASGCGVPGIMATKTIENDLDRRMTIITTTFIPCGAKLPVIALIGSNVLGGAWWLAPAMYFMGILSVVISGLILKRTKWFKGQGSTFVMELPAYHLPSVKSIGMHTWDRVKAFIIKAGTVIFVACGIVWFLSNFGWQNGGVAMTSADESFLADIGMAIAWVFTPLGFGNWQAAVATVTGLVAKENILSTLAVLVGESHIAELFGVSAAGLAFLVFNLLCAPCFAAMAAIKREMNSGKWTAFALLYQTGFAYIAAFIVYQIGRFIM